MTPPTRPVKKWWLWGGGCSHAEWVVFGGAEGAQLAKIAQQPGPVDGGHVKGWWWVLGPLIPPGLWRVRGQADFID